MVFDPYQWQPIATWENSRILQDWNIMLQVKNDYEEIQDLKYDEEIYYPDTWLGPPTYWRCVDFNPAVACIFPEPVE